jgi:FMN phosphatase YigB (HAD superfamily)
VLTSDPWQSILLTPRDGLVDRMRLDRPAVERAAESLWPKYSLGRHAETEYWAELGDMLGVEFDPSAVARASSTIRVNRRALPLLRGGGWGIVSDNTPFWYATQLKLLGVDAPAYEFLSFDFGAAKTGDPSLFALAAGTVDPADTLVVDDRAHNLAAAAAAGFPVAHYSMDSDQDLAGLVGGF